MTVQAGDKMPAGQFGLMTQGGPGAISTDELFTGKKVVLFSVPGAFTPTCSNAHLPGFVASADDMASRGVDTIACMAVNDVFVMDAWGQDQRVEDKVLMLADGNGTYTEALGLSVDASAGGMGIRGKRFAMIVNDGTVTHLAVEAPRQFEVSSAESVLGIL